MKKNAGYAVGCITALLFAGIVSAQSTSELWGETGELWSAQSRLPDFSFAGYHYGEYPIPSVAVVTNVADFGVVGDGVTDCTKAFQDAIQMASDGAIYIPEGRYVISGVLAIRKNNLVLRGAGPGKTILVMPFSLQQLEPAETHSKGKKLKYSFTGGFIHVGGKVNGRLIGKVASPAQRGDCELALETLPDVKPGQLVRLLMGNDPTLGEYLHGGLSAGNATFKEKKNFVDWVARVVSVENNRLVLDRPLRVDIRLAWNPELHTFEPPVSEVGIEDLTFEFPGVPKKTHLMEEGFNAINFDGAVHSWIRNVVVIDADNAVNLAKSRFCQIEHVVVKAVKREGLTGHHAFWATGNSQECLFTDFRLETMYVHDLTVEGFAHGNVFRNGSGIAINFDHHRNCPYENLFSNLDVGDPKRLWACGGRADRGPNSGVRETFWNLRWQKGKVPPIPDWPLINYIGETVAAGEMSPNGKWIEVVPTPMNPNDLHQAQLDRRLRH